MRKRTAIIVLFMALGAGALLCSCGAHQHAYKDDVVLPTCTEIGYTYHVCLCGEHYTDNYISATGHRFVDYIFNNDATCISNGTATAMCAVCDVTDTIVVDGMTSGHTFDTYTFNNDATCLSDGTETAKCVYCDMTDTRILVGSKGHDFRNYEYNNDATCQTDGTETGKCCNCGETDTRSVPWSRTPHAFGDYVFDNNATCLFDGTETAECEYCGFKRVRIAEETALGHSFVNYSPNNDATCKKNGTETAKCVRCNETDTREIENSKRHIYDGEWQTNEYKHSIICSVCGDTCEAEHEFAGKKCSVCGYESTYSRNLEFSEIIENDEIIGYSVTGMSDDKDLDVVIPSEYKSKPVIEIGDSAFYRFNLNSVTVPSSITSIGIDSFNMGYNSKGRNVYYSGDLAEWCNIEFGNCYANPFAAASDFYIDGKRITNLIIPNTVTEIKNFAFYGCTQLLSINISGSVVSIGENAFAHCGQVMSLKLNEGLERINESAFDFLSVESVIIPNTVTYLGKSAFAHCNNLNYVKIGTGVSTIGERAFYGCVRIECVCIPASVTVIENVAFAPLRAIILFDGTIEQWGLIDKYENMERLVKGIVCNDGRVK